MAKPRGYSEVNVPVITLDTVAKNDVVQLIICDKCGCVVLFPMTHNEYHKKNK